MEKKKNSKMNLELYFFFLVLMDSNITSRIGGEIITKDPYAVTPSFEGLGDLYLQLRNPNPSPKSDLTPKMKWQICKNIFVKGEPISPVNHRYEILLNPAQEEDWFRWNRRDIFRDIFEKTSKISLRMCMAGTTTKDYCLVNRSRLRKITVQGQTHQENVFECQTVDREQYTEVQDSAIDDPDPEPYSWPSSTLRTIDDKERIRRYFVSDTAYDVNEVSNGNQLAGRFVFYYDAGKKLIVLHALAEENTNVHRVNRIAHYLDRRNGYSLASNELDDPLCRLDPDKKLRICNAVLFQKKRDHRAEVRLVEERCKQRSFTLKGDPQKRKYSEWMMKCGLEIASVVESRYVSRAYIDNEVFVYAKIRDSKRLKLYGYKEKIAVLNDTPTVAESRSHRAVEVCGRKFRTSGSPTLTTTKIIDSIP